MSRKWKGEKMENRVTKVLGIEKPIIQGPTNWLTDGKYIAAISEAGGLGVLGLNAGLKESVFTLEETVESMRKQFRIARSITDKPLGMNIAPLAPEEDQFTIPTLDLMVEENIQVAVMVGFGFMQYWVDECHKRGIKVVYRTQTPTIEDTKAAANGGVDVIVATGFDEGGTIPCKVIGTFSAVPMIVDAAEGKVPVMACGGIVDERTAKAAFDLGAEGLYVGTAFLMSEESPMADNIKEMVVNATAEDLLLYRTVPAYYRSLPGELPNKLLEMSNNGATEEEIYEAQKQYIGMRNGMLLGDLKNGYASFGLGISMINKVEPASVIMDRLMRGVEAACK